MRQIKLSVDNISSCLCTFYNNGKADVMLIDKVQTKKEFRGQGYGTKLMNKALNFAKELQIDAIELVVDKNNKVAKKLYEKAGFKKTKKDHYRLILNKF